MTQIEKGNIVRLDAIWQHGPSTKVRVQNISGENITVSSLDVPLDSMPKFEDAFDFSHLQHGEEVTLYNTKMRVSSIMGGLVMLSPRGRSE